MTAQPSSSCGVLVGTYQRGEFRDYQSCVAAAHGEVESLRAIEHDDVRWQCLPEGR